MTKGNSAGKSDAYQPFGIASHPRNPRMVLCRNAETEIPAQLIAVKGCKPLGRGETRASQSHKNPPPGKAVRRPEGLFFPGSATEQLGAITFAEGVPIVHWVHDCGILRIVTNPRQEPLKMQLAPAHSDHSKKGSPRTPPLGGPVASLHRSKALSTTGRKHRGKNQKPETDKPANFKISAPSPGRRTSSSLKTSPLHETNSPSSQEGHVVHLV